MVTTLKQVINIKALFSSNLNGSNLQNCNLITSFLDICSDGVVIVDLEGKVLGVDKKFGGAARVDGRGSYWTNIADDAGRGQG